MNAAPREVMRRADVLKATGWSVSTLYKKMSDGIFPKPTRLDPEGRAVVWFADQVAAFQSKATAKAS